MKVVVTITLDTDVSNPTTIPLAQSINVEVNDYMYGKLREQFHSALYEVAENLKRMEEK